MSNNVQSSSGGGIGVCGLLGVLFVGLKLGGVINWSWLWVTCPFWIGPAIIITILAIVLYCMLIAGGVGLIAMGISALTIWFNSKKGVDYLRSSGKLGVTT